MARLLLWDIDGTLIKTVGIGTKAMVAAFEVATGTPMRVDVGTAGRTERAIFADALSANEVSGDFEVFAKAEAVAYRELAEEMLRTGRVLPGIVDVLHACAALDGVVQTLLTGNTKETADIKVTAFGLAGHFDLEIGAYGDDDAYRPNLVPIAHDRVAARHGRRFTADETTIIGDTPADVDAAHAHGARAIAVSTGKYTADDLHAAGADIVFADLSDTAAVLAAAVEE